MGLPFSPVARARAIARVASPASPRYDRSGGNRCRPGRLLRPNYERSAPSRPRRGASRDFQTQRLRHEAGRPIRPLVLEPTGLRVAAADDRTNVPSRSPSTQPGYKNAPSFRRMANSDPGRREVAAARNSRTHLADCNQSPGRSETTMLRRPHRPVLAHPLATSAWRTGAGYANLVARSGRYDRRTLHFRIWRPTSQLCSPTTSVHSRKRQRDRDRLGLTVVRHGARGLFVGNLRPA